MKINLPDGSIVSFTQMGEPQYAEVSSSATDPDEKYLTLPYEPRPGMTIHKGVFKSSGNEFEVRKTYVFK